MHVYNFSVSTLSAQLAKWHPIMMTRKCEIAILASVLMIIPGCLVIPICTLYATSFQEALNDATIRNLREGLFNTDADECPHQVCNHIANYMHMIAVDIHTINKSIINS